MDGDTDRLRGKQDSLLVCTDGPKAYVWKSVNALFFSNYLNLLMLCTPFAVLARQHGSDGVIFAFSLLAIAPFAERLSFVTEQLALHTNETLGGLLNATFGNVTELIVSMFAIKAGLLRIVQVSLLGSILSNLLLVLGCAFFFGGLRYQQQTFNKTACALNSGMLTLSVMSLLFPTVLQQTHTEIAPSSVLWISRWVSVLLLCTYCCYLVFQLHTHRHIFEDSKEPSDGAEDGDEEEEEEEEEAVLGMWGAVFWLAVITVFVAFLSEFMVDALEGAAQDWGVPKLFLGTIVIPIVGNAAEHAAAIIFACKNKMELALGIAVGSSTQIAMFVVPLCVVIAWGYDIPLSLDFHPFETCTLLLTVVLVAFLIQNGESNWLQGLMLVVAYCIVSMGFFVHCDQNGEADGCPAWSAADELAAEL